MIRRVAGRSKVNLPTKVDRVAVAKASPNRANIVTSSRPECQVIYPWPVRKLGKTSWRYEPVNVEKLWDELRVGVKG